MKSPPSHKKFLDIMVNLFLLKAPNHTLSPLVLRGWGLVCRLPTSSRCNIRTTSGTHETSLRLGFPPARLKTSVTSPPQSTITPVSRTTRTCQARQWVVVLNTHNQHCLSTTTHLS